MNEPKTVIFISRLANIKCEYVGSKVISTIYFDSVPEKISEKFKNIEVIYQVDKIELDELTRLSKIKNNLPLTDVIFCSNSINRKYSELIKRLDFKLNILTQAKCSNCLFSNNLKNNISNWLISNCTGNGSYYTNKIVGLISDSIKEADETNLSKRLKISERHLLRLIKSDYGKCFRKLINELKLYIIEELIVQNKFSDEDIADLLGYRELSNLHRFIKKMTGQSFKKFGKKLFELKNDFNKIKVCCSKELTIMSRNDKNVGK